MKVDRIMYIFGSFTRKKQDRRKSLEPSSISAGNSPLHQKITRPASQSLCVGLRTSSCNEGRKSRVKEWECTLCKRELVEPRLLGCLHSFCTRCLQNLQREDDVVAWNQINNESAQLDQAESRSASGAGSAGSAGSGYESDVQNSGSDGSLNLKPQKCGIIVKQVSGSNVQFLLCPTCGHETPLLAGGITDLPLNYMLLRKTLADNEEDVRVLCDLCDTDNKAESRCKQCMVSVCSSCGKAHGKQKATSRHFLEPLEPPARYCAQHQTSELCIYCATCQQVICRECSVVGHGGHALASAARAAGERARLLRDACDRARHVPEHVERAARALTAHAHDADKQACRVEAEVRAWAEQYRRAVDAHVRALAAAAARARARQRLRTERAHELLQERVQHAQQAVRFTEELLSDGREEEVLSLSGPVLRRLERLTELRALGEPPPLALRFSPDARAAPGSALCGRLVTHAPDPDTCVLVTDGLQDLHVECEHETILELRDGRGERIWCGGEQVAGYFRRRDSSERPQSARVSDRNDGTYALRVTPPAPGAYLLAVTVNNTPIKGSPFSCGARALRSHAGRFHCCAFCSSGGRRDATCGCGGTMPGGYKGCGHGHAGWPGARHWSCCGSTRAHGHCINQPLPSHRHYQFSL